MLEDTRLAEWATSSTTSRSTYLTILPFYLISMYIYTVLWKRHTHTHMHTYTLVVEVWDGGWGWPCRCYKAAPIPVSMNRPYWWLQQDALRLFVSAKSRGVFRRKWYLWSGQCYTPPRWLLLGSSGSRTLGGDVRTSLLQLEYNDTAQEGISLSVCVFGLFKLWSLMSQCSLTRPHSPISPRVWF